MSASCRNFCWSIFFREMDDSSSCRAESEPNHNKERRQGVNFQGTYLLAVQIVMTVRITVLTDSTALESPT